MIDYNQDFQSDYDAEKRNLNQSIFFIESLLDILSKRRSLILTVRRDEQLPVVVELE